MAMSDCIAVMYEGQFLTILDRQAATAANIGLLMANDRQTLTR